MLRLPSGCSGSWTTRRARRHTTSKRPTSSGQVLSVHEQHGRPAVLPDRGTGRWECPPLTAMARATFELKAKAELKAEQQLLTNDAGIKYDRFLAVDNDVAFKACGEFLCTRTRRSNDAGREITTSAKSIESYNTAMVNDIKRSTVRRASSKLRLVGRTLSNWTCTTCGARKTTRSWSNST